MLRPRKVKEHGKLFFGLTGPKNLVSQNWEDNKKNKKAVLTGREHMVYQGAG